MIRNARGLTLFEVMVGVAVMALITFALAQATWQATRAKRGMELREHLYHTGRVALGRIRTDLEMAFLVQRKPEAVSGQGEFRTAFIGRDSGEEDSIHLTTLSGRRLAAGRPEADQREVGYVVDALADPPESPYPLPDGTKRLLRREDPLLDTDVTAGGDTLTLAEGVRTFNLEYWDAAEGSWVADWDSEGTSRPQVLPRAVRITLVLAHPRNAEASVRFQTIAVLGLGPKPLEIEEAPSAPQ